MLMKKCIKSAKIPLISRYRSGDWVLMDYEDIIVHVFNKDNRLFYDLERIWRDGKVVEL